MTVLNRMKDDGFRHLAEKFATQHGYTIEVIYGRMSKICYRGEHLGAASTWERALGLMSAHLDIIRVRRAM